MYAQTWYIRKWYGTHVSCVTCKDRHVTCKDRYATWKDRHITCKYRYVTCKDIHITCKDRHVTCKYRHVTCKYVGTVLDSLKNTLQNCTFFPRRGWITWNCPFWRCSDSKHWHSWPNIHTSLSMCIYVFIYYVKYYLFWLFLSVYLVLYLVQC